MPILEPPPPLPAVADQCPSAVGLEPGAPWPSALGDAYGPWCSAVAIPTSEALDALRWRAYVDAVGPYVVELELDLAAARALATTPPPRWADRPAVARWTGLVVGVASAGVVAVVARRPRR